MGRKPRGLSETDRAHWAEFAGRVRPLDGPASLPPAVAPEHARGCPIVPPSPRAHPPTRVAPAPLTIGDAPGGVDKATWQRFRSGKLPVERTLDLHGRTAQHAHHALTAFLRAAHADRARCVEVVTGRGSGEEGGVIRREFRLWLNTPDIRPLVLAAAHPHAANQGAVRLLLRRVR